MSSVNYYKLNQQTSESQVESHIKYLFQCLKLDVKDLCQRTLTLSSKYQELHFRFYDSKSQYLIFNQCLTIPVYCIEFPTLESILLPNTRQIVSLNCLSNNVKIDSYYKKPITKSLLFNNDLYLLLRQCSINIGKQSQSAFLLMKLKTDQARTGDFFDIDFDQRQFQDSKIYLRQLLKQYKTIENRL